MKISSLSTFFLFCVLVVLFISHNANAYSSIPNVMTYNIFDSLQWSPDALTSNSQVIGNYEVILTTTPFNPSAGQTTQMEIKVYNYNQGVYGDKSNYASIGVNHFTMGLEVYNNGNLEDVFSPQSHDGNLWNLDYVFHESGNHVIKIDLYDTDKENHVLTYFFNVSVVTKYGPIFYYVVIAGAIGFAAILIWMKKAIRQKRN